MGKLRKNFGKRVRQLRKSKGLTQERLAEKARLEPTYLGAVERGERNLTIDNIEKIARGFRMEPYKFFIFQSELLTKEPDMTKEQILDIIKTLPDKKRKKILQIVAICAQLQK